jgi:hypothetical protein
VHYSSGQNASSRTWTAVHGHVGGKVSGGSLIWSVAFPPEYTPPPRPQPSGEKRGEGPPRDRCPQPVRAGATHSAGHLGGGPADQFPKKPPLGSEGDRPPQQSVSLRPQGPCPRRTCPVRHGPRRARHTRSRRLQWLDRSAHGVGSPRVSSSVSTCPVTLAWMVRVSSRSSTWA